MAEKKSTKAKSTRKNVRGFASNGEKSELPLSAIWNLIGFSSFATAILYTIGWEYISGWCAYFDIEAKQLNIPVQQVLLSSIPTIYQALFTILGATIVYLVFYSLFNGFKGIPFYIKSFNDFSIMPIWFMSVVALIATAVSQSATLTGVAVFFLAPPLGDWNFFLFIFFIFIVALIIMLGFYNLLWKEIPELSKVSDFESLFNSTKNKTIQSAFKKISRPSLIINSITELLSRINLWIRVGVLTFFYLLAMLSVTSISGYYDAMLGKRISGGYIQYVYYVSPKPLSVLEKLLQSCDTENNCIYGPFKLISDNETTFFLAELSDNLQSEGVYIMPRNDPSGAFFTVPYLSKNITAAIQPTPSPTTTLTPTPEKILPPTTTTAPTITVTPKKP